MADFIKVVDEASLSGRTKACILLSELSSETRDMVMKALKLSPKEIRLLNETFGTLSPYVPGNKKQCYREIDVLEEALDYGFERGILPQRSSVVEASEMSSENSQLLDSIRKNPSSIAGLLKDWMDEGQ